MHSQPDRPRRVGGRRKAPAGPAPAPAGARPGPAAETAAAVPGDGAAAGQARRRPGSRAAAITPIWSTGTVSIPVTARFSVEDLTFLAKAREELLEFTELGLRLADLHQPLDDGADHRRPGQARTSGAGAACGAGPARRSASWTRCWPATRSPA